MKISIVTKEEIYTYEYLLTFMVFGGEYNEEDEDCNAFVWSRREDIVSEEKNCWGGDTLLGKKEKTRKRIRRRRRTNGNANKQNLLEEQVNIFLLLLNAFSRRPFSFGFLNLYMRLRAVHVWLGEFLSTKIILLH